MATIKGSDGLEYENPTERLLNNPMETPRNVAIRTNRRLGYTEAQIREYLGIYDDWIAAGSGHSAADHHAMRHLRTIAGELAANKYPTHVAVRPL